MSEQTAQMVSEPYTDAITQLAAEEQMRRSQATREYALALMNEIGVLLGQDIGALIIGRVVTHGDGWVEAEATYRDCVMSLSRSDPMERVSPYRALCHLAGTPERHLDFLFWTREEFAVGLVETIATLQARA